VTTKRVIGLAGPINSGKSKLMKKMAEILNERGFKVLKLGERRSIRGRINDPQDVITRQTLMLTDTISELIPAINNPDLDFIFVERDPWDSIAFSEGLIKANLASRQEVKHLLDLAEKNTRRMDLVILILVSEETSIERRKKGYSEDPVTDNGNFRCFERAYQGLEKKLPPGSIILNGEEDFDKILKKVIKVLFPRTKRKINGIPKKT